MAERQRVFHLSARGICSRHPLGQANRRPGKTGLASRYWCPRVAPRAAGPGGHTGCMPRGTVRFWNDDEGWGVIDSADTPGACWVHFSNVVSNGFSRLMPGEQVTFTYETARQDGFDYRAVLVWPAGIEPEASQGAVHVEGPSAAYRSSLTIRWPDGNVTTGIPKGGQDIKETGASENSEE